MNSLKARASIMEDNAFWEDETNSSAKSAPSGTRERSSNSASDRRQPESRSFSSKAGQMRLESLAVADGLALHAAGAWATLLQRSDSHHCLPREA